MIIYIIQLFKYIIIILSENKNLQFHRNMPNIMFLSLSSILLSNYSLHVKKKKNLNKDDN